MNRTHVALLALGGLAVLATGPRLLDELTLRRDPLAPRGVPRAGVVLCVGDSATFGVGVPRASSWPDLLRAGGVGIVSRSAPRLHSADAVRELSQWLAEVHPEVVLLSVGADDVMTVPAPLIEPERERIEGRSRRSWFSPFSRLPRAEEDPALLAGSWRSGATVLQFDPDGQLRLGDRSVHWHTKGPHLYVDLGAGAVAELSWFRHRDTLDLDGPILGGPMSFTPLSDDPEPHARARRALQQGLFLLARVRLEQLHALGIDDDRTRRLETDLDVLEGRAEGPIPVEFRAERLSAAGASQRSKAIGEAIALARAFGARVILVGHAGALATLDQDDATIAQRSGARVLRIADAVTSGQLFDTTALPTAAGHARIAELVRAALAP